MRFCFLAERYTILLIIFLFFSSVVYAQDLEIKTYRDSYNKFETVQLGISLLNGTFSASPGISNLQMRDSSGRGISIAKNSLKINETKYFYYFDVPDVPEGEYEIVLSGISYAKEGVNYFSEFVSNLSVVSGAGDILSVRPGYAVSNVRSNEEASFSLILVNRGSNGLNVVLNKDGGFFSFQQNSFSIVPGQTKNVGVITRLSILDDANLEGKIRVNYGSKFYDIPFLIFRSGIISRDTVEEEKDEEGVLDLSLIEDPVLITTLSGRELKNLTISLDVNEYYPSGQVIIKNNAGIDLTDVEYSINGDIVRILSVSPLVSDILGVNESAVLVISVDEERDFQNGEFFGSLDVKIAGRIVGDLPIFVSVYGAVDKETVNESGVVVSDEKKNVTTVIQPEEEEGLGLWILLIFVVLLLILFYVYKKTKIRKEEFEGYIERIKR